MNIKTTEPLQQGKPVLSHVFTHQNEHDYNAAVVTGHQMTTNNCQLSHSKCDNETEQIMIKNNVMMAQIWQKPTRNLKKQIMG